MLGQKKEIFLRRRTVNGQDNRSLPYQTRLSLFVKIINGLSLSRAFDCLFTYQKKQGAIIQTRQGKVDKNLFNYLMKRNQTSFSDLRSRSPIKGSKSIYSRNSRSRTPVKRLRVRRKNKNGSMANFGKGRVDMDGNNLNVYGLGGNRMNRRGTRNLYRSQNLTQNPNFFKLTSDKEIPLSSKNIIKSSNNRKIILKNNFLDRITSHKHLDLKETLPSFSNAGKSSKALMMDTTYFQNKLKEFKWKYPKLNNEELRRLIIVENTGFRLRRLFMYKNKASRAEGFFMLNKNSLRIKHMRLTTMYLGKLLNSIFNKNVEGCLLYTSPSPRDGLLSRMPSSA